MTDKILIKGYGLIKLLAIISTVGFMIVALTMVLNSNRMNDRNAARVQDITKIKLALVEYLKSSVVGYPASNGECLNTQAGVGAELLDAKAILSLPVDPLWPAVAPAEVTNGVPEAGQKYFCYFYFSEVNDQFKISFFLEANSQAGQAGINIMTQ